DGLTNQHIVKTGGGLIHRHHLIAEAGADEHFDVLFVLQALYIGVRYIQHEVKITGFQTDHAGGCILNEAIHKAIHIRRATPVVFVGDEDDFFTTIPAIQHEGASTNI